MQDGESIKVGIPFLHLCMYSFPSDAGMLKKLTTLKVDDNQLTSLPHTIGR